MTESCLCLDPEQQTPRAQGCRRYPSSLGAWGQLNGEVALQMDLDGWQSKSWPGGKFLRRGNYTQRCFDNSVFKAYSIWKKIFSGPNQPLWKLEKCIKKDIRKKKNEEKMMRELMFQRRPWLDSILKLCLIKKMFV